ncbi:hypothetical protein B0H13DRAFT_2010300 [Mycena leptocephala]|nr:hypothetical protein B0H13DRAFT_2010300 [Mycena leptocephala]
MSSAMFLEHEPRVRHSYSQLPTPRTSHHDKRPASRAATLPAPIAAPQVQESTKHMHAPSAASIGLQTPSSSLDIIPAKPPVSGLQLLEKIKRLDFTLGPLSQTIKDIPRAIWIEFEEHAESVDYRLEYSGKLDTVIVTCASSVHESFAAFVKPFAEAAQAYPTNFVTETNTDILIPQSDSLRVPDFALSELDPIGMDIDPKYRLIFECAWSQPKSSVESKAQDWLLLNDVVAVVSIDIQGYSACPPPSTREPNTTKEILPAPREFLGPVAFEGHVWAKRIPQIMMYIHHQTYEREEYDITPAAPDAPLRITELAAGQAKVENYLRSILKGIMTDQRFDAHFGADRQFRLDWDQFYKVDEGLVRDGYKRYSRWVNQLHPPMPKQQKPKRRRPDDETNKTSEASKKSPKKSRVELDPCAST